MTAWQPPPEGWPEGKPWPPVLWARPEPPPVIAYCAPGRTLMTALTLMWRGERVARIEETPHLGGRDILVAADPRFAAPAADPEP